MRNRLLLFAIGVALLMLCVVSARADIGNVWARRWGGTSTTMLPAGSKVINAAWKTNSLWVLMRERKPDEQPETYVFKEFSTFGLLEGTMILKEQ